MMKFKNLFLIAIIAQAMASCTSDGNYNAGFSRVLSNNNEPVYANTATGFIGFACYGNAWRMEQMTGSDWCGIAKMEGTGGSYYEIKVTYDLNATGSPRLSEFMLRDTEHGDEAYVHFALAQYATRGDGSLGNAPLVNSITGDDGSAIAVTYDSQCRPIGLTIKKNETQLKSLTIRYNALDSTITVNNGSSTLTGKHDTGYQPDRLYSATDTVGYYNQSSIWSNDAVFNVEEHKRGGEYTAHAIKLTEAYDATRPDAEHIADSLRYKHHNADGSEYTEMMKMTYGDASNRCQSVDVNQLLLGVEECNPYMLVSLFRKARMSKIVSEASTTDGKFVVSTTLNSDKSVNTMTVTDKAGARVTYTFAYSNN